MNEKSHGQHTGELGPGQRQASWGSWGAKHFDFVGVVGGVAGRGMVRCVSMRGGKTGHRSPLSSGAQLRRLPAGMQADDKMGRPPLSVSGTVAPRRPEGAARTSANFGAVMRPETPAVD